MPCARAFFNERSSALSLAPGVPGCAAASRSVSIISSSETSMPSASMTAASAASRRERALGLGLGLGDELLLGLAGDLEVLLRVEPLL